MLKVCFIEEIVRTLRALHLLQRADETLPKKTTETDSSSPARLLKTNPICFGTVLFVNLWSLFNGDNLI